MKHLLSRLTVFVVLLFLLSGCTPVGEQPPTGPIVLSDELLTLLETVNAEHKAIVKPEIDEAAIIKRWARDISKYTLDYQIAGSMTNGVLTAQQAKNDVNVLFHYLQTKYGLYEYFGGDEVFDAAREAAILEACDAAGTLTPDELASILVSNLSFIDDAHFTIADQQVSGKVLPFHYRDVAFAKTENGYRTVTGNKCVVSVDGYEDLEALFRRSIASDGSIVYYPIVLARRTMQERKVNPDFTPGDLKIHYDDGTTQTLSAIPFRLGSDGEKAVVELYKNQSVPVLFSREMGFDEAGDPDGQAFLAYAEKLKNEPMLFLDLRSNAGGNATLPYKWLQSYTGASVTSNSYTICQNPSAPGGRFYVSPHTLTEVLGSHEIGGGLTVGEGQPDSFVRNDNLIIVLMGKNTASAAESFVDLLHNVENVLFVGDNTSGCLIGSAGKPAKLPCSLIPVQLGETMRIFPEGEHFEEMRGFFPDLWVPAAQAEELALKLILNSK